MDDLLWLGAYSAEKNKYVITTAERLCGDNLDIYIKGHAGYMPLCMGYSREEVVDTLSAFRQERGKCLADFEVAMCEAIYDGLGSGVDVEIVPGEATDGDGYMNDVFAFTASGSGNRISVNAVAREYYVDYAALPEPDTLDEIAGSLMRDISGLLERIG